MKPFDADNLIKEEIEHFFGNHFYYFATTSITILLIYNLHLIEPDQTILEKIFLFISYIFGGLMLQSFLLIGLFLLYGGLVRLTSPKICMIILLAIGFYICIFA